MGKGGEITQSNSNHFCLLRSQQPDNVEGKYKREQTNSDEENTNALIGYWKKKKNSIFFQFQVEQRFLVISAKTNKNKTTIQLFFFSIIFSATKHKKKQSKSDSIYSKQLLFRFQRLTEEKANPNVVFHFIEPFRTEQCFTTRHWEFDLLHTHTHTHTHSLFPFLLF